jgi:hypothetical protein
VKQLDYVGDEEKREIIFKWIVKEYDVWVRTELICFRISVTGGIFMDTAMKFRVP